MRRIAAKAPPCARGCLAARGDYVAFIDADLATPPEALASAGRRAGGRRRRRRRRSPPGRRQRHAQPARLARRLAGQAFTPRVNLLLLPGIQRQPVPAQGVSSRRRAAHSSRLQRIDTWSFDAELLYLAHRLGSRHRSPVVWSAVEGSHLRLTGAVRELWNLLRIRWMHRGVKRSLIKTSHGGQLLIAPGRRVDILAPSKGENG